MRFSWIICDKCDARVAMGGRTEPPEGWHMLNGHAFCAKCWAVIQANPGRQWMR